MRTLRITADLKYNDKIMHGDGLEEEEWFMDLLLDEELRVYSNEIGDEIGTMRILKIEE
jgi:hypothetical protein